MHVTSYNPPNMRQVCVTCFTDEETEAEKSSAKVMGLEVGWQELLSQAPRGKQNSNRSPCFSAHSCPAAAPHFGFLPGNSYPILHIGKTEVLSSPDKKLGRGFKLSNLAEEI